MPTQRLHPFTARFEPELYEEVQTVTKLRQLSINQFVMTAVRNHLRQTRHDLMREYGDALQRLRAYAEKDPNFDQALVAFARAEVENEDPVEGTVSDRSNPTLSKAEQELEEILGA